MTLRSGAGKFSLPSFGRKSNTNNNDAAVSPTGTRIPSGSGPTSPTGGDDFRPPRESSTYNAGTGGGFASLPGGLTGSGGSSEGAGSHARLDGIGRKLGKSLAHTSLLPALGNQDLRLLQDVISTEKGVMTSAERLAVDIQTAAAKLAPYGAQEGDDLRDILGHSGTLLNQMSIALRTFAQHEASLRTCFKRIREREEVLDEIRRRRRTAGQKADSAERKLAKMGPENKQLVGQTELLETLRGQMRQLDSDIVNEESKVGDFKRQTVKEALSFKFGGFEELGEKMCIIGELGKLLLEEIPLEETPPGYGRAPYTAKNRTDNTVTEAVKCLATVQFHASSAAPKPPGLPRFSSAGSFGIQRDSRTHTVADHEQFEHLPGVPISPPTIDIPTLGVAHHDESPYGGIEHAASSPGEHHGSTGETMWQSPRDTVVLEHDYEYQQQREIDAERQAAEAAQAFESNTATGGSSAPADHSPGFQPLRLTGNDRAVGTTLTDGPPGSLGINQDAFAPLSSDSWLTASADPANPIAQPPGTSHSCYYTPEEDANATGHGQRKASVPSDVQDEPHHRIPTPPALSSPPAYAVENPHLDPSPEPVHDPEPELDTPRQTLGQLPWTGNTPSASASAYSAPLPPPAVKTPELEVLPAVSIERESYYRPPPNTNMLSANTLNVSSELPAGAAPPATNNRDTYLSTVPSEDRYSYMSYQSYNQRDSMQTEESAVVVSIPAEPHPVPAATPTLHNRGGSNGHGSLSSSPVGTTAGVGGGATMSAAAFRRGVRPRMSLADSTGSDDGQSFGHSADGSEYAPAVPPASRRLPQAPSTPPRLTAIVAATLNGGIGRDGTLPWQLPGEMKYFARVTTGEPGSLPPGSQNALIMGRKTWDGIPMRFRPLKNRANLVISAAGVDVTGNASTTAHSSLEDALAHMPAGTNRAFLIGGAQLYNQALPVHCDRVLLTRVQNSFECDAFLRDFTADLGWRRASHQELNEWVGWEVPEGDVTEKGVTYQFEMWVRDM